MKQKYFIFDVKIFFSVHNFHVLLLWKIRISKDVVKLSAWDVWSSDATRINFEDVTVLKKFLIGNEEMGFKYQMVQHQEECIYNSSKLVLEQKLNSHE